jgi:hypothetical protein
MPEIVFAAGRHLGRCSVADVRIVSPNDRLAPGAIEGEQRLHGFEHVAVAQIPGCARAIVHDAIVTLGVGNEAGVLHRVHEALAVALRIIATLMQKIGQYAHDIRFAGWISSRQRGVAIGGRVRLPRRQAAVSFARDTCAVRVDLIEILESRADGIVEAVEIEPVKRNAGRLLERGVVMAKPINECAHLVVSHIQTGKRAKAVHSDGGYSKCRT